MNQHIIPINPFIPAYEAVVGWPGAFTAEECDKIRDFCELAAFQQGGLRKGQVGDGDHEEDLATRDTDIVWLEPTQENDWVHRRISDITGKVNFDHFNLDLVQFDAFQFSQYQPDGHYDWHVDSQRAPRPNGLFRKLSLSLLLTDPSTYEGGELLFNVGGDQEKPNSLPMRQGDILFFYSHIPHKVTPVTKGTRQTLVSWVLGEKLR